MSQILGELVESWLDDTRSHVLVLHGAIGKTVGVQALARRFAEGFAEGATRRPCLYFDLARTPTTVRDGLRDIAERVMRDEWLPAECEGHTWRALLEWVDMAAVVIFDNIDDDLPSNPYLPDRLLNIRRVGDPAESSQVKVILTCRTGNLQQVFASAVREDPHARMIKVVDYRLSETG